MRAIRQRFVTLEGVIHGVLVRYSTSLLRVAVGAVFLGFGLLKFFPGVSPAESLVTATKRWSSSASSPRLRCCPGACSAGRITRRRWKANTFSRT